MKITVFLMPGSQYSAKVLVALDSRKIEHYVHFVEWNPKTRKLPSGNTTVPEILVERDGQEPFILADSDAILEWFDESMDTSFLPTPETKTVNTRASTKFLAGAVLYYNWVNDQGYQRTMRRFITENALPGFLPSLLSGYLADWLSGEERKKFLSQVVEMMDDLSEDTLKNDEPKVRARLVEELRYFQSFLLKTPDQPYLMGTDKPTGADFSVYVMVERLVGDMGDVKLYCSIPELMDETKEDLATFWAWYGRMRQEHPIRFKGKRAPK